MRVIGYATLAVLVLCGATYGQDLAGSNLTVSLLKPAAPIASSSNIVKIGRRVESCSIVCTRIQDGFVSRNARGCPAPKKCECWCDQNGAPQCSPCK